MLQIPSADVSTSQVRTWLLKMIRWTDVFDIHHLHASDPPMITPWYIPIRHWSPKRSVSVARFHNNNDKTWLIAHIHLKTEILQHMKWHTFSLPQCKLSLLQNGFFHIGNSEFMTQGREERGRRRVPLGRHGMRDPKKIELNTYLDMVRQLSPDVQNKSEIKSQVLVLHICNTYLPFIL